MRTGIEIKSIGPLVSWDIFMQGYRKAQQLADDRYALLKMSKEQQWQHTFDFNREIFNNQKTILVTSPFERIIFASSGLYEMSGYHPEEVIGQSPNFFQGPETMEETRLYMRQAIRQVKPFETQIINYRKDGSTYNCHVIASPVFNKSNRLVNYIAFETAA